MVLGTAQLGLKYGIANQGGKPSGEASAEIVEAAWRGGVRFFDTAQAYGDSEAVLGRCLREVGGLEQARVITKLDPALNPEIQKDVYDSIVRSSEHLGIRPLWAVLLHRAGWLRFMRGGLGAALGRARDDGWVRFLGVSVYSVEEAREALAVDAMDMLQLPCNAWDQRMLTSGLLAEARRKGRLCFVRSIFLQGLLLMPAAEVAARLPAAASAAACWHAAAARQGIAPTELAMRFALGLNCPLVVGAERVEQVQDNLRLLSVAPMSEAERQDLESGMKACLTESILNPSLWPA